MPHIDHPDCSTCSIPMWLTKFELGEIAHQQQFECMACGATATRTVPAQTFQDLAAKKEINAPKKNLRLDARG